MEELKINITVETAMDVISTLKKMNIFDDMMAIGVKVNDINKQIENINLKVLRQIENYSDLEKEEKEIKVQEVFEKNAELAKKYNDLQQQVESEGAKILSKIVMSLPTAKEEVFSTISKCIGKTKEQVKTMKLHIVIDVIKQIIKSEDVQSLMAFFN